MLLIYLWRPITSSTSVVLAGVKEAILETVVGQTTARTRGVGHSLVVTKSTICWMLKGQSVHAYHLQQIQTLTEEDYSRCVNFACLLLKQTATHQDFAAAVFFSCTFAYDGAFYIHNKHVWVSENLNVIYPHAHQRHFIINVLERIINVYLIRLYFLPERLDEVKYQKFL